MLQNNHSLARPCPSCGAPLRVHAGRMSQKLQCPKCLDTIVLEPAAVPVSPPERAAAGKNPRAGTREPPAPAPAPAPVAVSADQHAELLLEHAELTERYAALVSDYETLVAHHAELAIQMHRLGGPDEAIARHQA